MKEQIEKLSKIRLDGFPEMDYLLIKEKLEETKKVDVWLLQGMGRKYLKAIVGENTLNFPLMTKLCTLTK